MHPAEETSVRIWFCCMENQTWWVGTMFSEFWRPIVGDGAVGGALNVCILIRIESQIQMDGWRWRLEIVPRRLGHLWLLWALHEIQPSPHQEKQCGVNEWTKTKSFEEWSDTHGPDSTCNVVIKNDCIQHIGKCFRNKLEDLSKKGAKAGDDKSMYSGKHRLGKLARTKLQTYFNNAVRSKVRPGILTKSEEDEAVIAMRNAIMGSLYYCLLLSDEEKRHQI